MCVGIVVDASVGWPDVGWDLLEVGQQGVGVEVPPLLLHAVEVQRQDGGGSQEPVEGFVDGGGFVARFVLVVVEFGSVDEDGFEPLLDFEVLVLGLLGPLPQHLAVLVPLGLLVLGYFDVFVYLELFGLAEEGGDGVVEDHGLVNHLAHHTQLLLALSLEVDLGPGDPLVRLDDDVLDFETIGQICAFLGVVQLEVVAVELVEGELCDLAVVEFPGLLLPDLVDHQLAFALLGKGSLQLRVVVLEVLDKHTAVEYVLGQEFLVVQHWLSALFDEQLVHVVLGVVDPELELYLVQDGLLELAAQDLPFDLECDHFGEFAGGERDFHCDLEVRLVAELFLLDQKLLDCALVDVDVLSLFLQEFLIGVEGELGGGGGVEDQVVEVPPAELLHH